VQAATAKTQAETATTSADEALKRAQAAQQRADTIESNFERFTLQAQRELEANIQLRAELRDQIEDFNQVYQRMRGFEEQLKTAELKNSQLESELAHVKEVLGQRIEALTRQNQEQGQRITDLEADREAREVYINRIEALIPEPDRTEVRKHRPNGRHHKEV
jgi:DNA repair exonuclease SbcCD ATPase subunit